MSDRGAAIHTVRRLMAKAAWPPLEAQSRLRFAISHYKLARASFRAQKTKTEVTAELAEMFEAERSSADQACTKQDQE
jgi:hypothetical protein